MRPLCQRWPQFLQDMINGSCASHILSHIHCSPFQWSNDTLSHYCLCIVILNTLDLMVPLLKRHFSLSRSGITTKSVGTRDAHPQSGCKHAAEMANVCSGLEGLTGYYGNSLYLHPSSHLGPASLLLGTPSLLPTFALRFPWGPLLGHFSCEGLPTLHATGHHPGPNIPGQCCLGCGHLGLW